jgi:hypothetical protein
VSTNALTKFRADPARRNRTQFSASQVDLFRSCPRKWFLQYVAGVRTPGSPSQVLGTKIHSEFEGYLISGEWPGKDEAAKACAQAALRNLPKPGKDLAVEAGFQIPLGTTAPDGTPQTMIGFVDLAHARASGNGTLTVRDHKTTKDYVWNKTEAELRHNVQANIYAYWAYGLPKWPILFPVPPTEEWRPLWEEGVEVVEFGHHYVKTQKPLGSTAVATPMPWEKVSAEWVRIRDDVEAMTELAATGPDDPLFVEGNKDSCGAFGGCYFGSGRRGVGYCTDIVSADLTKKIRSEAEQKEIDKMAMSIREKIAARKAAQQGGAAPATSAPAETPKAAETAPAAAPAAKEEPKATEKAPAPAAEATGVVSSDAPSREQTAEEAEALAPTAKTKKRAATKKAQKTVTEAAKDAAPTGEEMAAADEAIQEKADEVRGKLAETASGSVPSSAAPLAAYKFAKVDCMAIDSALARSVYGGDFVPAERWLDPIKRAVADEFGEPDYALIEFGKGKAALAAAIKATADTLPRLVYVSSFSRSADVLVDELIAQGYVVEKAVRG